MKVVAKDYQQLIAALNLRRKALGLTLAELDEWSGLADRHCSKLMSATPTKFVGGVSLGCLLAALGLKIVIVDDREAFDRIKRRLQRQDSSVTRRMPRIAPTESAERGAALSAV